MSTLINGNQMRTMTGADGTNAGAAGAVPAPAATDNTKYLRGDGTWAEANGSGGSSRNIGEIVASTVPLTDAGLHLLDGSLISGDGAYSAFVDYMANMYSEQIWTQPTLTADGTMGGNSFAVYASTVLSGNASGKYYGSAYYAFDGNINNAWHGESNVFPADLIFYNPQRLKVSKLTFNNWSLTNPTGPATGKIYASNDSSTWTELTSFTNTVTASSGVWEVDLESNTQFYNYYKIQINSSSYGYAVIGDVYITATYLDTLGTTPKYNCFIRAEAAVAENIVPTDISSSNTQGFTVSATSGAGDMYLALNPDLNTTFPRWQGDSSLPQSIQILFPEDKTLDYYTITQWCDGTETRRIVTAWTLYYTADGGTTWIECDSRSGIPATRGYQGTYYLSTPIAKVNGVKLTATAKSGSNTYFSVGQMRFYGRDISDLTPEEQWQQSVATYGVCGKFVYDNENNTIRLPKITGIIEGTVNEEDIDSLVEAGLPNITGRWASNAPGDYQNSTEKSVATDVAKISNVASSSGNASFGFKFDASLSNAIYGNSSTVQPQTIKVLYYIVIATSTKTEIEVDIDEIATDLNGKCDVDGTNATFPHIVETYVNGTSGYIVYSNKFCEQWGTATVASGGNTNVGLLKTYADMNYGLLSTSNSTYYGAGEANNTAIKISASQINITNGSHLESVFSWRTYGYLA